MLKARAKLLQKYLCDEQKELQALYALQALVVTLEQPASKSQAAGRGGGGAAREQGQSWKGSQPRRGGWSLESRTPWWLISSPCMGLFPGLQMEGGKTQP